MPITMLAPNTIYLSGPITYVNDLPAIETVTPGMVLERHNDAGVSKWGVHDSADAPHQVAVALEQLLLNLTVDDTYAAGDLVHVGILGAGATFWGIIPSGQNIANGAYLQSNGDGKLKALGTGQSRFQAMEGSGGAVTEDTRIRVEVLY